MKRDLTLIAGVLLITSSMHSQMMVDADITPEEAVHEVLLGDGVTPFNVIFTGGTEQMGTFTAGNEAIEMSSGIILSTGDVQGAPGPNNTTSNTEGGGYDGITDPDLVAICGTAIHDAAILEFDVEANGDSLLFTYVFASEEYNEYVCSNFNDAFGFFVSGPGIEGPYSNNAVNIALIPASDVEVSINTVNGGEAGVYGQGSICSASDPNWQSNGAYFIDNDFNPSSNTVQYDGFTVPLIASVGVQCGEVYHIKLAIGDAFDYLLDSAVFIESNSFSSYDYTVEAVVNDYPENGEEVGLVEGCVTGGFAISRPAGMAAQTIQLTWSGTASAEEDFNSLPTEISMAAGETAYFISLEPLLDETAESTEVLTLAFPFENACGNNAVAEASIPLYDYQAPEIIAQTAVESCPGALITLAFEPFGGLEPYSWMWPDESMEYTFETSAMNDTTCDLIFSDYCNSIIETAFLVTVPSPLHWDMDSVFCSGDPIALYFNGGTEPYEIQADVEIGWTDQLHFTADEVGFITLTLTDDCNTTITHTLDIQDCTLMIPNVFTPNNDGVNDRLVISGLDEVGTVGIEVFNRWGIQVFASAGYLNNWDAYGVSDGVYYLTVHLPNGDSIQRQLTILR